MVVKAALLIENVNVEGNILAGLDVYASSHPHLKAITGTMGSVLSKRFMLGLGWRDKVVEGGLEGEANPHQGEDTSSSRNNCLVVGDAISAISARRPKLMCRNRCRAATLSLLTLSLLSQLLSGEERRSWLFDPKIFATAVTPNGTRVYTLLCVSHERKLMHTGSGSESLRTSWLWQFCKDSASYRLCA